MWEKDSDEFGNIYKKELDWHYFCSHENVFKNRKN